jgi:drug/metabolite transporter (DMT)-like permease
MVMRQARKGLSLSLLAAATFGTSGTLADSLINAGWSPAGVVLVRISLAALFLTVPAIIALRGRWGLLRDSARMIAAFGLIAVAACQVTYFNAVSRLSVGVALMIQYLGIVVIVVWLWARHGHRPRRLTLIGSVAAILGLGLVLNLTSAHRLDPIGVAWALAAAVGLAIFYMLSAVADEPLPPVALAWAGSAVGAIALAAVGATGLTPLRGSSADVDFVGHRVSFVVPILGLSLVAAAIAYIALISAARILGSKLASFVGLTEVLFAVLFAWILLGQLPGVMQLIGGLFIVGGVVLVRIDELRSPAAPGFGAIPPDSEVLVPKAGRSAG